MQDEKFEEIMKTVCEIFNLDGIKSSEFEYYYTEFTLIVNCDFDNRYEELTPFQMIRLVRRLTFFELQLKRMGHI